MSKRTNFVSSSPLKKWIEEEGINQTTAGASIGVSGSTISGWLKDGEMPRLALTAIEGVKRRKRLPNKTLMITLLDAEQTKTMKAILPPLGIDSKFMEVE